jgi:hypothetical protein
LRVDERANVLLTVGRRAVLGVSFRQRDDAQTEVERGVCLVGSRERGAPDPRARHERFSECCPRPRDASPFAVKLEPLVELVFIDAPLARRWRLRVVARRAYGERDPASADPEVHGPRRHYKGWADTRDALVACFEARGPFDGVLGFSQRAALAGLLLGLRAPDGQPIAERPLRFGSAILVSGFPSSRRRSPTARPLKASRYC